MMPVGPMMIEHRLIERMIKVMDSKMVEMKTEGKADMAFIETAVDFIRTYADRCHHGKEEDILFRELKKKTISQEHHKIMEELIEEHRQGRKVTSKLVEANERYMAGDSKALDEIIESMQTLVAFYPRHIEKEDKHFFIPVMKYFNKDEKDAMLKEGYEFDQGLIHEKYRQIVERGDKNG
ncbi:MAG: hemerythrin domain-containing protein [Deltaproteobacteria bacterium]|nr:hemerythrin domain-containing protein [Deltaproteobacteria bacterium]